LVIPDVTASNPRGQLGAISRDWNDSADAVIYQLQSIPDNLVEITAKLSSTRPSAGPAHLRAEVFSQSELIPNTQLEPGCVVFSFKSG